MDVFFFDFDVLEAKKGADGAQKETGDDAVGRRARDPSGPSGEPQPASVEGEARCEPRAGAPTAPAAEAKNGLSSPWAQAFLGGAPTELSDDALAEEAEETGSSCWHTAGGGSSATGAESCKSCFTWQTGGSATPSERGDGWIPPRLPRTDTCSSLASSWCSDSEPVTPTAAQAAQDRWTPALVSEVRQAEPKTAPVSISAATSRMMRFGQPPAKCKVAWSDDAVKQDLNDEDESESYLTQLALRIISTLMPSELVGLICGKDFWHNHGVPRVGIPAIRFTDGPFGARGPDWSGPCSVVTPCGMALASSWNVDLVQRVGTLLGEESKTKGASVLLGPTVNLSRVPIAGRNYELMGEDPILTSKIGVAYIQGVQAVEGMAACVKHLAVNDQEKNRFFVSAEVDRDVLRSLHLVPFEAAVKEGRVMAVMTAYNRVNGTFCSEHKWLIEDVLRKTWGFKGMVVSDWGGTHSTEASLKAGLDMEMPKTDNMFYGDRLQKLLAEGKVAIADVRSRATVVLKIMARLGLLPGSTCGMTFSSISRRPSFAGSCCDPSQFASPVDSPNMSRVSSPSRSPSRKARSRSMVGQANEKPATPLMPSLPTAADPGRPKPSPNTREQQALLQRAAAEGVVLLKNKGVLPLSRHKSLAVIGPNAASMTVMGGGSATVLTNRSERSLVAQLRSRGFQCEYEQGCRTGMYLPTLAPPFLHTKDGRGVLKGEFYDESARRAGGQSRTPIVRTIIHNTEMGNWSGIFYNEPPGKIGENQAWSATFEGVLSPQVTGPHELGLFASGSCKVYVDGSLVVQVPKTGAAPLPYIPMSIIAPEVRKVIHLEAGRDYELKITWMSPKDGEVFPAQFHLGGCPVYDEDKGMERAVEIARRCDQVLVCVGTDHWQECEGRDQASMELPGRASELIQRLVKVNNKVAVVLNVGSPKELEPWLDDASALLAAWFGGQEAAAGLADVLLGEGDGPAGRLPVTWPRRMDDGPTGKAPNARYPGEAARVKYDEGLLLGYRWYDANGIRPAFQFGHGLTYTFFEYIDLCLPDGDVYAKGQTVSAVVTVENVGDQRGMEVIQLYVVRLPEGSCPVVKELGAFAKVALEPGDVVDAKLEVAAKILEVAEDVQADFELLVGPSCADVCFGKRITVGSGSREPTR